MDRKKAIGLVGVGGAIGLGYLLTRRAGAKPDPEEPDPEDPGKEIKVIQLFPYANSPLPEDTRWYELPDLVQWQWYEHATSLPLLINRPTFIPHPWSPILQYVVKNAELTFEGSDVSRKYEALKPHSRIYGGDLKLESAVPPTTEEEAIELHDELEKFFNVAHTIPDFTPFYVPLEDYQNLNAKFNVYDALTFPVSYKEAEIESDVPEGLSVVEYDILRDKSTVRDLFRDDNLGMNYILRLNFDFDNIPLGQYRRDYEGAMLVRVVVYQPETHDLSIRLSKELSKHYVELLEGAIGGILGGKEPLGEDLFGEPETTSLVDKFTYEKLWACWDFANGYIQDVIDIPFPHARTMIDKIDVEVTFIPYKTGMTKDDIEDVDGWEEIYDFEKAELYKVEELEFPEEWGWDYGRVPSIDLDLYSDGKRYTGKDMRYENVMKGMGYVQTKLLPWIMLLS